MALTFFHFSETEMTLISFHVDEKIMVLFV
jgi:hypothetical protein